MAPYVWKDNGEAATMTSYTRCTAITSKIPMSFGAIACRCEASGLVFCFLICFFMFLRYYFTVWPIASTYRPSERSFVATCPSVFILRASFETSSRSGSSGILNRAFFQCTECCLIVTKCCRCRKGLYRCLQTAARCPFPS